MPPGRDQPTARPRPPAPPRAAEPIPPTQLRCGRIGRRIRRNGVDGRRRNDRTPSPARRVFPLTTIITGPEQFTAILEEPTASPSPFQFFAPHPSEPIYCSSITYIFSVYNNEPATKLTRLGTLKQGHRDTKIQVSLVANRSSDDESPPHSTRAKKTNSSRHLTFGTTRRLSPALRRSWCGGRSVS